MLNGTQIRSDGRRSREIGLGTEDLNPINSRNPTNSINPINRYSDRIYRMGRIVK